jgi:hypothetical protein
MTKKVLINDFCACGCGNVIGEWNYKTGRKPPTFIKTHALNVVNAKRGKRLTIFIDKPCACGCGQIVGEWKNRPSRKPPIYKGGHQLNNTPAIPRKLNKQGYVLIHKPEYENSYKHGYILEHRYVMEQHLGRKLQPGEDVHHKNHDKQDNRIDNLEIIDHTEHSRMHRRLERERKVDDK